MIIHWTPEMDFMDLKKLKELLEPPQNDSSDSEDDLPKSSLVQLCKCKIIIDRIDELYFVVM